MNQNNISLETVKEYWQSTKCLPSFDIAFAENGIKLYLYQHDSMMNWLDEDHFGCDSNMIYCGFNNHFEAACWY